MVFTSLRTDEEALEPGFFPIIPAFRAQSPYVRRTPAIDKPLDVADAAWKEILPQLERSTRSAVEAELRQHPVPGVDADKLTDAAVPVLVNQLAPRLPRELYRLSPPAAASMPSAGPAVLGAYQPQLTPAVIGAALDDRLARLELRNVQVRTIDGHVTRVLSGHDIAGTWRVLSGNAQLVPAASDDAAVLRYHFDSPSSPPIVLRYEFDLPADPNDLHKLFVSLKDDDSWHRRTATLDFAGGHWVSTRTTYIAQHRPESLILQPPSFDDQTFRNKIWVPLKRVGPAEGNFGTAGHERAARLTLTIHPSSTAQAIYGKTLRNYERAFYQVPFLRYIFNSAVLVLLVTAGTLLSSTFVAYAFARLNWPGKSFAFLLLLSTMMLPTQVTFIPQFLIWRTLGWYNTLNPIWVPAWLGVAFFVFLMTQYMKTIPRELEEAARIDGLNAVQTWWYIMVPLVKPAAAAIAIMTIMGAWNEFLGPLIYLRDQAKFPLSLGLFGLRVDVLNDWTLLMAGNVMMTLPVLILFFLFQRYFIEGMTMSGMKG